MSIQQVTVFVPNERGSICRVTKALAEYDVDIRALSVADTEHYGILRLIVKDTDKAFEALSAIGYMAQLTDVIGVKINDKPGRLNEALEVLDANNINLEYLYAFMTRTEKHAYVILRVHDNDAAAKALEAAGFHLVTPADVAKI